MVRNIIISNGNIKSLIGKRSFATNFEIKCVHCKCWHWKSKICPYIIWYVFGHMLVKFEQNCMVRNIQNFELFNRKPGLFKAFFWTKLWRHLWWCFCSWNNCWMLNYWFEDSHLSVFWIKKYESTTLPTRLKVASNMADPISIYTQTVALKYISYSIFSII